MKILKKQVLSGPNRWSNYRKNLIQVRIDLEDMEAFPTDKIDGFNGRLKNLLPSLVSHECSEGCHGGFFKRLERGTWMGHVMEHVALEIQTIAGMQTGYGRTRGTSTKGIYNMVFAYEIEEAGLYAAEAAFRIVEALQEGDTYDLDADIAELTRLRNRYALGPSTQSIVNEAVKRGIPWKRLSKNSKIQLGYGSKQQRFQATMTCRTTADAVAIAGDKDHTKRLLANAHIPVAAGGICKNEEELLEIIYRIGFPVVLKPLDGNQGKGATIDINDLQAAKQAFEFAKTFGNYVLVEKFIEGYDYRLLVIDGKFVAAAKRIPAHVIGNGTATVRELIAIVNSDPARGDGHENVLTKIKYSEDTHSQLEKYNYTLESVPAAAEVVYLKSTANLSTGGTAVDFTDEVCNENRFMAERIAKIIGLDICGIDVMATSMCRPLSETDGAVIEVNAAPGFRMHLQPSEGKPRNVAKAVVDMLYPPGSESSIPLIAVTGTNGKTTTTRLLAHLAKSCGFTPGYTTTDGIYIGDHKIKQGDTTGPLSAATILQDPMVDFAVLETARGGLLRSGLYFDHCDVGIITNIQEDHLGLNDIETLEDLANVKAVVARSVKKSGTAVLNAEDANCIKIADTLDCKVVFFSLEADNPYILKHTGDGKTAVVLDDHNVVLLTGNKKQVVENTTNIPLTENGTAAFMTANVLAATAAAFAQGFTVEQIRKALQTFVPGYETTPGRMNLFDLPNYKILVDYAHNPHGLLAMKSYLQHIPAQRKIGIIAGIGDRLESDIVQFASIAASMFDHIIVRQEHHLRGRTVDEINALVSDGIKAANPNVTFDLIPDERAAITHALNIARKGDYIVALSDEYNDVIAIIKAEMQKFKTVVPLQNAATSIAS